MENKELTTMMHVIGSMSPEARQSLIKLIAAKKAAGEDVTLGDRLALEADRTMAALEKTLPVVLSQ